MFRKKLGTRLEHDVLSASVYWKSIIGEISGRITMKATKRTMGISYAIREMLLPARELEKQGHEIIKLHIGDPNKFDFETPKHVRDALCGPWRCDNGYEESEGNVELRKAIIEKEKQEERHRPEPRGLCHHQWGNGSYADDLRGHHRRWGRGARPRPSYPSYTEFPKFFGGAITYLTMRRRAGSRTSTISGRRSRRARSSSPSSTPTIRLEPSTPRRC